MKDARGSMLMETVIVMPLLLALVFGALQIAHIHAARQIASYAAFAAARATLAGKNDEEESDAKRAAQRVLCFLAAVPDGLHDGVMMPDPEADHVKKRLLQFKVIRRDWEREVELKFAFPLVIPLAGPIIARRFNPVDFSQEKAGPHISEKKFGDSFEGPHLILHERMTLPKPYIVRK